MTTLSPSMRSVDFASNHPLFSQLALSIENGNSLTVNKSGQIQLHNTLLSKLNLVWQTIVDPSFVSRSDRTIVTMLSTAVILRQEHSIQQNHDNLILELAKRYLKTIPTTARAPHHCALRRHLTAARLGIKSEILQTNPDFQQFAERSHIHRYLSKFNHQLKINSASHEIKILYQNCLTSWKTVASQIKYEDNKWTGHYSQHGIQMESLYEWTQLNGYMTGNPEEWDNKYIFEYVVWEDDKPSLTDKPKSTEIKAGMTGSHTYIRLRTPDKTDNIISVGIYRPEKRDMNQSLYKPLRIRKARLMKPDESEFWGGRLTSFPFAITKKIFEKIKHKIESDQAANNLTYQLTQQNCNEYTRMLARLAGIDIPSFLPITKLIGNVPEIISNNTPTFVSNCVAVATAVSFNAFSSLSFLGAQYVDKDAQCSGTCAKPIIQSVWDVFDVSKAQFSHPCILGKALKKIEAWRANQITSLEMQLTALKEQRKSHPKLALTKQIDKTKAKILKIKYAIPKEFKLCQKKML